MSTDPLAGKRVLILGGLGFIGSNLAHRMIEAGARVTVYDALIEPYGGNLFNVDSIARKIRIVRKDIRDEKALADAVRGQDLIFNFAAQVSYIDSLKDPFLDLDINVRSHLLLLELCRRENPGARIFFASSRFVYGKNKKRVVSETEHPKPLNMYGIHKLACEHYLELYAREFGISSVALRIMNPYGPRQQMKHSKYSLVGWFIRQAMEGKTIRIFGDGRQKRDYIFIDDLVDAFMRVARKELKGFHCFNVGTGTGVEFRRMVEIIVDAVGKGRVEHVPWPANYEKIETGSFIADTGRLVRLTGWKPRFPIEKGIARTYRYYREHRGHYWQDPPSS